MDIPEVRRRLRGAIESARRTAQERRSRIDQAARDYDVFLKERAVPVVHTLAAALAAEGFRFTVHTPADSVRLASESAAGDYIELGLDSSADPPVVLGRSNRGRGRRMVTSERPVREGAAVGELTEDDVLSFLIAEIPPFVER